MPCPICRPHLVKASLLGANSVNALGFAGALSKKYVNLKSTFTFKKSSPEFINTYICRSHFTCTYRFKSNPSHYFNAAFKPLMHI